MAHHHHHHHHIPEGESTLPIALTVLTNITIAVAELIGGFLSGSVALTADAFHNLGDSLTSLLVWIAKTIERREADKYHTFGFRRAEVIASFTVSLLLFAAAIIILKEIIERTLMGGMAINASILLPVAVVGLLGNVVGIALLHRQAKSSMSVRGAMVHLISDALSSVLVVTEGVLLYMGFKNLWYLDLVVGGFIVYFLFSHAYEILKESMHILMEGAPKDIDISLIESTIRKTLPDVKDIHSLKVHTLNGDDVYVTVHIVVPPSMTAEDIDRVRDTLIDTLSHEWERDIHLTLQVESHHCQEEKHHTHNYIHEEAHAHHN